MGRRLGWGLLLMLLTSPAFAETVVLEAVLRGPSHAVSPDADYTVSTTFGPNVFVFDLAPVSDPIVGATLVAVNPPGGFASPQRRETYTLFAVTDASEYADAGEGVELGSLEVDEDSPSALEIPLAAPILRVLERTDGHVAIGGRLTTAKKLDGSERLFAGTGPGSGVPAPQLVLTTDAGVTPAPATTLHVDDEADPEAGDGSTGAPFASIVIALDLAAPGDVVEVAPGVYAERVRLKRHVELHGSGSDASVVDVTSFEPEGVAVICADDASLAGFRIIDPGPPGNPIQAAVDCSNGASPEIAHNVIEAPRRSAIWLEGSSAWIHHNRIRGGNGASESGAAIVSSDGVPAIEDNEIESNGVAMLVASPGEAEIRRNLLRGLAALYPGPDSAELAVSSNVFLPAARFPSLGGLVARGVSSFSIRIIANTFDRTDGIELESSAEATIASNLIGNGTAGIEVHGGSAEIRNNDVFDNHAGIMGPSTDYVGIAPQTGSNGNISADPQFVDAFFEDFRLRPTSPALDAGSEDEDDGAGDEDFDGDPRVADGDDDDEDVMDMGAQELQPGEELPEPALPITVDVLPGRSPNELKFAKVSKGRGKVAVAILSGDELDAPAEVDVATLILDREPALRCSAKDADRDGTRDLVCSFPLRGISIEDWPIFVPPACVRGTTHGGRKLLGCDEVEIVP